VRASPAFSMVERSPGRNDSMGIATRTIVAVPSASALAVRQNSHHVRCNCHVWSEVPVILYNLLCFRGHAFEGWFTSIAAYDEQAEGGKLFCPICNSRKVGKAPMAPALATSMSQCERVVAETPVRTQEIPQQLPDELRKMRQFVTGLRTYVEQNAEYVGRKFPDEARKIHYGESEERHIYGEASLQEAADLVEEGIDLAPLPPDLNETN